ncbi:MAG: succinate dehydrogenase [Verrucomicrobia bacterium]|nr:succinate dehydrogenase [Verrucomicrobiota bacterium]MBS0585337.1 succinate dehydrogenase [Verrucomicrobiota bacterium]
MATSAIRMASIPKEFVWKRMHSLMGLWFLIFLAEHLFTNSQAALFFGDDGYWFVHSVDFLRNIPYLPVIEMVLLGIPIVYHMVWGVYYMMSSKSNAYVSDGSTPLLKYKRNRAYSWQRYTAWILLVGLILHVVQMRFLDYPYKFKQAGKPYYYLKLVVDPGLYPVADRLGVKLFDRKAIMREKNRLLKQEYKMGMVKERIVEIQQEVFPEEEGGYNSELDHSYQSLQGFQALQDHIRGLESRKLKENEVMAVSSSFGSLELLSVRQTFQSITMCILYSIFVAAAVFHGFNGLWTFLITWGLILSRKSHTKTMTFCLGLMFVVGFLGMMSIWGTYFINLKY